MDGNIEGMEEICVLVKNKVCGEVIKVHKTGGIVMVIGRFCN